MDITTVLKTIQGYNVDILTEEKRVLSYITDLLPGDTKDQRRIRSVNIDRILNSSNSSSNSKPAPELSNLYQLARRARDLKNNEDMANYYKQILLQNPNDWEATLYTLYAAYWTSKIASVETMLRNFYNSQELILRLINENVSDDTEKMNAVAEVGKIAIELSEHFFAISQKYYAQNTVENLNKYVLAINARVTLGK